MKKRLFSVFTGLLFILGATASPVDANKAALVASGFYNQLKKSLSYDQTEPSLQLAYSALPDSGSKAIAYFYIFNVNSDDGFIIVSGDDRMIPVLGYSKTGSFEKDRMHPSFASWLKSYELQAEYAITNIDDSSEDISEEWQNIQNSMKSVNAVVELATPKWGQDNPFNSMCPMYNSEGQTLTGCVATSMAIIMKYKNYPERGTGSRSYTWNSQLISANFNYAHDWNNMLFEYNTTNPSAVEIDAVSILMRHCGISVESDYGINETGADTYAIEPALTTYFKYDKSIHLRDKSKVPANEWISLLKNELDNNRPVIYRGEGNTGGHAFICDGYDNLGKFRFNWGWRGYLDGYFALDALNPSVGQHYNNKQFMLINIKEADTSHDYSSIQITDAADNTGMATEYENVNRFQDFSFTVATIQNTSAEPYTGILRAALTDKDSNFKGIISLSQLNINNLASMYYYSPLTFNCRIETDIVDTDLIRLVTSTDNGQTWKIVSGKPTTTNYLKVKGQAPAGIDTEQAGKEEFSVYASGNVICIGQQNPKEMHIRIADINGRMLYDRRSSEMSVQINILNKGIYLVNINGIGKKIIVR